MYLSLIITFLLLLALIITSIQNSMPLELKILTWKLEMSLTALIFYSSLFGGAIVAVLTLPNTVKTHLRAKKLNGHVYDLKKKVVELEKGGAGKSRAK